MSEQESVVETETEEPQAATGAADAQETDIETYLKEFEESDDPKPKPEQDNTNSRLEAIEQRIANQEYRDDMDSAIGFIRGDVDSGVFDNAMVEGWLNAEAHNDPRIGHAFMKRHENPEAYKRVREALAKKFQGRFKDLPDKNVTEDRDAVASAVRGASKSAPETDDFNRADMLKLAETNPAAFKAWTREQSAKLKG